jgi:hypothetical protein
MSDAEISELPEHIQSLVCPITLQIMCCPISASDGMLYESEAFIKYIKSKNSKDRLSPKTREVLRFVNGDDIKKYRRYSIKNVYIKGMLDEFFDSNKQYRHLRYKPNINIKDFLKADEAKKTRLLKERKNCFKKRNYLWIDDIDGDRWGAGYYVSYYNELYKMIVNGVISKMDIINILDETYLSKDETIDDAIICALFNRYSKSEILLHKNCKFVHSVKLCERAIRAFAYSLDKFSYFCRHMFDNDIDVFNEFWHYVFANTGDLIDEIDECSKIIIEKSMIDLKKICVDDLVLKYDIYTEDDI